MKAAILLVKLKKLGEFTSRRRHNAAMYDRQLANSGVTTPKTADGNEQGRQLLRQKAEESWPTPIFIRVLLPL
jgi:dTDP-4-amino-4,6-dideoxygalactose transaminase